MSIFDSPPSRGNANPYGRPGPQGQPGFQPGSRRLARMQAKRDRRRNRTAALLALVLVGLLVFGVGVGGFFFWQKRGGGPDYAGPGQGRVVLQITDGQTITSIGNLLTDQGVIKSTGAFIGAAKDNPDSARVHPGWYALREEMSAKQALEALLDPSSRAELKVTIPEGWRKEQIVRRLAQARGLPEQEFTTALGSPDLGLPDYAKGNPEGFLYPSTYEYAPSASPLEMLQDLVARFKDQARALDIAQLEPRRSAREIVIVASMVQAEAKHPEDFGKVARVVYNRLDKNMELGFDSTVNYALNASKVRVSIKDTEVNSPYNTYRIKGLPPGPINSPGDQALRAALQPTDGRWLYFVSVNEATGQTKFAETEPQFELLKKELACYRTARDNGVSPQCG